MMSKVYIKALWVAQITQLEKESAIFCLNRSRRLSKLHSLAGLYNLEVGTQLDI